MIRMDSRELPANARDALADAKLQAALVNVKTMLRGNRAKAVAAMPEYEAMRDAGVEIKRHTLANLDVYLERFEQAVVAQGGKVHFCPTAADARKTVAEICRVRGAKLVTKSKSMITEEIGLNPYLEAEGFTPVETDLGEYIVQLRHEPPSHLIAPASHIRKEQVAETFREAHVDLPADRPLATHDELLAEARKVLRERFLSADVGITGANILVAETGSIVVVTNEGNADLTQTLPRCHIAIASIEKVVPTLEDATTVLRLLARSATGQEFSSYTTLSGGVRRDGDLDGPEEFHVVLVDNGRSALVGGPYEEMLRCIRCGACINHCPIFGAIGGHAFGSVYVGPMGMVLSPLLFGLENNPHHPHACTLCGRCGEICPMRIPLPRLLRQLRDDTHDRTLTPAKSRWALRAWTLLAEHPAMFRLAGRGVATMLRLAGGGKGRLARWPLAGEWTKSRDLPLPEGGGFVAAASRTHPADRG